MLFRPLLNRVGPKVRMLVSGGAALEESLIWKLEGLGWRVRNGYGLAEGDFEVQVEAFLPVE